MTAEINWTEELEDKICEQVSSTSLGLVAICKTNPWCPGVKSLERRMHENPDFRRKYVRAKALQADILVEEILEIADDSRNDTITVTLPGGVEKEVCNIEWVQRSRLRVDTRKWLASKLIPKIYGDVLPKKLDMKMDLTKPFDILCNEITNKLYAEEVTLDEAQGAFDLLKKYAELTKIPEFEKQLQDLQSKLSAAANNTQGQINEIKKEVDTKSDEQEQGLIEKKARSKKRKTNSSSKIKKGSKK